MPRGKPLESASPYTRLKVSLSQNMCKQKGGGK